MGRIDQPRDPGLVALGGRTGTHLGEQVRERPGALEGPSPGAVDRHAGVLLGARTLHEALDQAGAERIAQTVLHRARGGLEVLGVVHPAGVAGNVGPGADGSHAAEQGLDVSAGVVHPTDVPRQAVFAETAAIAQLDEDLANQACVGFGHQLAIVGDLTGFPQQADPRRIGGARHDLWITRQGR